MPLEHLTSTTALSDVDPLRDDFRKFLWLLWGYLNLPDPTQTQYEIAEFLQNGPNKICIEAFRGVGKSFITSAFALWVLYRDPQMKIMVVSASKNWAWVLLVASSTITISTQEERRPSNQSWWEPSN